MKLRNLLLAVPMVLLAGCGDDLFGTDGGTDAGTGFALTTGTYKVSNAALASGTDQCDILGAYTAADKVIKVSVTGSTVSFNLAAVDAPEASKVPTATLSGNSIANPVESNFTITYTGTSCVSRAHSSVVGNLTADNTGTFTLTYKEATDTGTCDATIAATNVWPCQTSIQFTAIKQ